MKKILSASILIVGLAMLVVACATQHPGFDKTESGLYYKFHYQDADGKVPQQGDVLTLAMVYRLEDSILFDSRPSPQPMALPLTLPEYPGDIYEALAMMKVGDSATFILSADSFFMKTVQLPELPPFVEPGSVLHFDIKMLRAQSMLEIEEERLAKLEVLRTEEPLKLAAYLAENNITTLPRESGLYFIEKQKGTGRTPKEGDHFEAHFIIETIDGKRLFSSHDRNELISIEFGKHFDNDGVTEALRLMRNGSRALIIVPSSLAYADQGRGEMVPPYTTLVYDIEIVEHKTKEEFHRSQELKQQEMRRAEEQASLQERQKLIDYLSANNITVAPTASGLYFIERQKGTGARAEAGKKVTVHYTGTLLDGTKFDSSVDRGQPFEFTLGAGQVIAGWDEGIKMMSVGGKATLIIPSALAYGSRSMGPNLPAYSTLVFEVELLGVE